MYVSLIPELYKEMKLSRDENSFKTTIRRISLAIAVMEYRVGQILRGELMPTENEWGLLANFIGGSFRRIPYAKIEEAFSKVSTETRLDNGIIDDGEGTSTQNYLRHLVPNTMQSHFS